MKSSSNIAASEPPLTSNRRQPLRQTRTNPSRNATGSIRPFGGRGSLNGPQDHGHNGDGAPGFFPAIQHFTDSITALPKEMIRHYTMLKEVDAKIYGPEETLAHLAKTVLKTPVPPRIQNSSHAADESRSLAGTNGSINGSIHELGSQSALDPTEALSQSGSQAQSDAANLHRRNLFLQLRMVIGEMLMTLDEKNHVISTANDALDKQLARCDSSYPAIEGEISEEARYGNINHWAYTDKTAEKKGTTAGERTRREAAAAATASAAVHESDMVASRSEARREAVAARKQRAQQVESDFDESRGAGHGGAKKAGAVGKGKKVMDTAGAANGVSIGLGIANGPPANGPNKRRKVEKPTVPATNGGLTMERSMSSVYGPTAGVRGGAISPRETPAVEAVKKRARATTTTSGTGRKRANTNASAVNSPSLASSPVVGTFAAAKDLQRNSPAPSISQRSQPHRARQNSSQSVLRDVSRNGPSPSTSSHQANGTSMTNTTVDIDKVAGLTGRSVSEVKSSMKEAVNPKGEHLVEDSGNGNREAEMRGGLLVGSRSRDKSLKREDTENGAGRSRADRPPSISTSTRGGKASKTSTPVGASFPEPPRPRSSRATEITVKRSHKKGAGIAAQLAAAAAAADEEASSLPGNEEEEEDDTEPRYCYCNQVSYGEMVACDMDSCPKEWFHLDCVGLSKAPTKNAKWYCDECKENVKKGKFNTTSSSR